VLRSDRKATVSLEGISHGSVQMSRSSCSV